MDYLINRLPHLATKPDYCVLESDILRSLFYCLELKSLPNHRKKFNTDSIRKYIHDNIHNPIDLVTMSNELNINESQLHHTFKIHYGISPMKYLQMLRFNAVRQELLRTKSGENNIQDIASKYCFVHMNHFTSMYKKIFEELPSQTLRH